MNRNLAISWISVDPTMSSAMAPVIAAEHFDWNPYCKVASYIDEDLQDDLANLAVLVTQETRKAAFAPLVSRLPEKLVKQAGAESLIQSPMVNRLLIADAIKRMILENPQNGRPSAEQTGEPVHPAAVANSGASANSEDSSEHTDTPDNSRTSVEVSDEDAGDFLDNNKDVIDEALTRAS